VATVADSHLSVPARAGALPCLLLAVGAPCGYSLELGSDLTLGGNLTVTSDYIYRGVSESDGHAAFQADLHVASGGGTFVGVWGSTRDNEYDPYADYDVEIYLGQRFDLSTTWSATLSARSHYFVAGPQEQSADYQELSGALTYLDRWTLSVTAIPNAVHYWYELRLGRSAAWVADTTAQWLLIPQGLFVTGGVGYYYADRSGPGIVTGGEGYYYAESTGPAIGGGGGYVYGNAGFAFERRHWRLDVGYFRVEEKAQQLFPYPLSNRVAGTLSWRF